MFSGVTVKNFIFRLFLCTFKVKEICSK